MCYFVLAIWLVQAQCKDIVDVYVAGFPCQPFSLAGRCLGFEDRRGLVFFEILQYLTAALPKVVLLENVTGMLTINSGQYFRDIIGALEEIGKYNLKHAVIDTAAHGVPQHRERVYIVGIRKDVDDATFAFPVGLASCIDLEDF